MARGSRQRTTLRSCLHHDTLPCNVSLGSSQTRFLENKETCSPGSQSIAMHLDSASLCVQVFFFKDSLHSVPKLPLCLMLCVNEANICSSLTIVFARRIWRVIPGGPTQLPGPIGRDRQSLDPLRAEKRKKILVQACKKASLGLHGASRGRSDLEQP